MAARRRARLVFPADIHRVAADIRRQALQNPDKDPVVPGAPRVRKTAKRATKKRSVRKTTKRKARGT